MNRHLLFAIKAAISLGLLVYLLGSVDVVEVWQRFLEGQGGFFAVAIVIYWTVVVLSTIRWKVLLDPLGGKSNLVDLTLSYLVSAFFANFLPSNVGGDVVRVEEAARAAGSRTASLTVAVVDRIAGFVALYFIAVPAYFLGGPLVQGLSGARFILLAFTALVVILGGLFLFPKPVSHLIAGLRLQRIPAVHGRVLSLQGALNAFRANKGALVNAFLLSLVLQFLGVMYFYFVARALRIPLDLGTSMLMVPLCTLIQALPISFNGWGLREGVYVVYFRQVGLPRESALAFSIVAATLVMVLSVSGLFVWLGRRKPAHEAQSPPAAT